jgi:hypothetical protein
MVAGADVAVGSEESDRDTQSFVVVSRDTLAKLGVLDKISTSVLGASFPSAMTTGSDGIERMVSPTEKITREHAALKPMPSKPKILHVSGRGTNIPGSRAPLVLEVENLVFGPGEFAMNAALMDHTMNTFVRLHAVLGDVVYQARAKPEVIPAEDDRFQLLDAKEFAARLDATDQTVYNMEKAGRLISVLPPSRVRNRRYPAFQLNPRLNRTLHELAIAMYRSHEQDMTLYWDFLRTRHQDFGGSTGVDFLLNRVAEPGFVDLEQGDLNDLFLSIAEEDMSRAIS